MQITILTLFPGMFDGPFGESIVARARESGLLDIDVRGIREYCADKHRQVDDSPYGGGGGMVLKPEPVLAALEAARADAGGERGESLAIYMSPQGRRFDQSIARDLAGRERLILLCGHYEGVDQRALDLGVDMELSVGDYVLTGGELPAMVVVDTIARLLPGALGNSASAPNDSFWNGILDCPHYTRPPEFRGASVPPELQSGDAAAIERWRLRAALRNTRAVRPDLLSPETIERHLERPGTLRVDIRVDESAKRVILRGDTKMLHRLADALDSGAVAQEWRLPPQKSGAEIEAIRIIELADDAVGHTSIVDTENHRLTISLSSERLHSEARNIRRALENPLKNPIYTIQTTKFMMCLRLRNIN